MRIVQEMQGGFEFLPIDVYSAKSPLLQIIDGKLMPSQYHRWPETRQQMGW